MVTWFRRSLLVVALFALNGGLAQAQPAPSNSDEDPRAVEAQKACIAGEVDKGVRLLADYFASTGDTIAVYNIGRCYEQNGLDGKAVPKFREYLLKAKDLTASERAEIEKHVGELEARQRASAAPVAATPPATSSPSQPPSPGAGVPPRETSGHLRMAGVALGAVGVAGIAAGAIFALKVRATNDDLAAERAKESPAAAQYTHLLETGRMARTLQWVSFGVGTAALVAGTTCYLVGRRNADQERIAISPWIALDGAGAAVTVSLR
jgi:hypothetical protein